MDRSLVGHVVVTFRGRTPGFCDADMDHCPDVAVVFDGGDENGDRSGDEARRYAASLPKAQRAHVLPLYRRVNP